MHLGATSQDIVDTSLMLRLKEILGVFETRLARLVDGLATFASKDGSQPLMAFTRMQAALPFTVGDKIETWQRPLKKHLARLATLKGGLPVQLGGPVGTGASFGDGYPEARLRLAELAGLKDSNPWHSDRTVILDIAQALTGISGSLGKIGQDLALMAQAGDVCLPDGGGSSAMAHKRNSVGAELLVTFARLNAGLLGTLVQSLVHENERSGAAWTLEWLLLPRMCEATGAALLVSDRLIDGAFVPG